VKPVVGAAILATIWPLPPAVAGSVAETMAGAGLLGSWAVDCAARPAPANPHLEFAAGKEGDVIRHLTFGPGTSELTAAVRSVERQGNDTVHLREVYTAGVGSAEIGSSYEEWGILAPDHRHYRSVGSIGAGGHEYLKNGIVVASGKESVWMTKCKEREAAIWPRPIQSNN